MKRHLRKNKKLKKIFEKFLPKISIRKYSVKVSVDNGASINLLNKIFSIR